MPVVVKTPPKKTPARRPVTASIPVPVKKKSAVKPPKLSGVKSDVVAPAPTTANGRFKLLEVMPGFQLPLLKDVARAKLKKSSTSDLPYWGMIKARFLDVQQEARCFASLYDTLVAEKLPTKTVVEVFGGVGMSALILRAKARVDRHLMYERDPACLAQLRALFAGKAGVTVTEVKDWTEVAATLPKGAGVVLDFNSLTALQYLRSAKLREALGKVFEAKPAWVLLTDSACSKFHLNLKYYKAEEKLGLNGKGTTYADYVAAFSKLFSREVGYKIQSWRKHRRAGYFLLQPK